MSDSTPRTHAPLPWSKKDVINLINMQWPENATLVSVAVNNHDALVEALWSLNELMIDYEMQFPDEISCTRRHTEVRTKARDALLAAKGETNE